LSWTNLDLTEVLNIEDQLGIFARTDIEAGTVVGVFDGILDIFDINENGVVDWRGQDGSMALHLRKMNGKLFALMPIPNVPIYGIDYINHSCTPNCIAASGLIIETTRFIARGEQLTLNYLDMDLIKLGLPCWCDDVPNDKKCIL